jgi:hypothetical protein
VGTTQHLAGCQSCPEVALGSVLSKSTNCPTIVPCQPLSQSRSSRLSPQSFTSALVLYTPSVFLCGPSGVAKCPRIACRIEHYSSDIFQSHPELLTSPSHVQVICVRTSMPEAHNILCCGDRRRASPLERGTPSSHVTSRHIFTVTWQGRVVR